MHLLERCSFALLLAVLSSACTSFELAERHVAASVDHSDEGLVIPDDNGAVLSDRLRIDDDCTVVTVEVEVEIRHPFAADVSIDLVGPSTTVVRLLATDDFEDGERDIDEIFPGSFEPFDDLIRFGGEQGRGEWTLVVRDDDIEDQGTLESWLLRLGCES